MEEATRRTDRREEQYNAKCVRRKVQNWDKEIKWVKVKRRKRGGGG